MARIRTIKPEILEDEKTAALSDRASRLFHAFIVLADDHGNLRGTPEWLYAQIFWKRPDVRVEHVAQALEELAGVGLIWRYTAQSQQYLAVINFRKHQRVDNAGKPRVPGPDEADDEEIRRLAEVRAASLQFAASRGETRLDHDHRPPTTTTDHDHAPPQSAAGVVSSLAALGEVSGIALDDKARRKAERLLKRPPPVEWVRDASDIAREWGEGKPPGRLGGYFVGTLKRIVDERPWPGSEQESSRKTEDRQRGPPKRARSSSSPIVKPGGDPSWEPVSESSRQILEEQKRRLGIASV